MKKKKIVEGTVDKNSQKYLWGRWLHIIIITKAHLQPTRVNKTFEWLKSYHTPLLKTNTRRKNKNINRTCTRVKRRFPAKNLFFINDKIFFNPTRTEFLREILYNNIAIIAIQHSKIYFVDTFGDFSHTAERNSLKSVWQISLYKPVENQITTLSAVKIAIKFSPCIIKLDR